MYCHKDENFVFNVAIEKESKCDIALEQQTQVVHIPKTHQKLAQDDPSLIFIDVRSSRLGNPIIIEASLLE